MTDYMTMTLSKDHRDIMQAIMAIDNTANVSISTNLITHKSIIIVDKVLSAAKQALLDTILTAETFAKI